MRGKCDNEEGGFKLAHPFPKVLGYKRGSDTPFHHPIHTTYK